MTGGVGGAMVHRSGRGGGTLIQEGPLQNKQCEAMTAYGGGRKPDRPTDRTSAGGQAAPPEAEFGDENSKKYIWVVGINI